jgi:hypothetical protein
MCIFFLKNDTSKCGSSILVRHGWKIEIKLILNVFVNLWAVKEENYQVLQEKNSIKINLVIDFF